MIKSLVLALPFLALGAADTTVAVLEIGSKTVVRNTSNSARNASPNAVKSFWASLHDVENTQGRNRRALSAQGLSVVGDLFNKPDAGVVMGVSATKAQLANMPELTKALRESVGDMTMRGSQSSGLLTAAKGARFLTSKADIDADATSAKEADAQFSRMLAELQEQAASADQTIVLHLVVDDAQETRRQLAQQGGRELEDQDEQADNNEEENNDGEEAANDDGYYKAQQKDYSDGFYGYGYVNDNGEYVVVSKTIFQIQYQATVLWTSIGLVAITFVAFSMTANMPMMPDSMLFGESAKMMGA